MHSASWELIWVLCHTKSALISAFIEAQDRKALSVLQGILVDRGVRMAFVEFEVDGTAATLREGGSEIAYPSWSVPWAPF